MKRKLLFILSLASVICSHSQTYKGNVVDAENRQPLNLVSVSITDAENMTLAYTVTDEKGGFELECKNCREAKYLQIGRLGYQPQKLPLADDKSSSLICLSKSDIKLKEVKVKYQPIRQTGDTLSYDVAAFRLGQDRNIRDVLKRLPGIEIGNSGLIKYEGKAINKFYVENMDLTDGRYNLISNNLSAKSVKSVQVLENHQPVNAMQGVTFSDQAALNLVLENSAKGKLVGIVELGAGVENKSEQAKVIWENKAIGMLFKSKLQNISIHKNANTGIDIKEDLTDFKTGVSINPKKADDGESSFFSPMSASGSSSVNKQRWLFSDAHFVSQNTLSLLSKNSQLRIQASYLHEKETEKSESSVIYLLPNGNVSIVENSNVKNVSNQINSRLTYELNSNKNYIKNTFNLSADKGTNEGASTGASTLRQTINLDRISLSNDFSMVHRIDSNRVAKFSTINSFNRLPQRIIVNPGLYKELVGDDIHAPMAQNVTISSFNSHSFTSFSHPLFLLAVDYDLGVDLKNQLLESSPDGDTSTLLGSYTDSLSNKFEYTDLSLYLSPRLKFQREFLKISLALRSTITSTHCADILRTKEANDRIRFMFEPSFWISYDINAFWKINANSIYNKNYSDIRNLYTGYILNSYRSVSRYGSLDTYNATFTNSMFLSYKQPIKGIFLNFSGSYSRQYKNSLPKTSFTGVLKKNSSEKTNVMADKNILASINASKTLPFWSSLIKFEYSFADSHFNQYLSGIRTRFRSQSNMFGASLTLSPVRQFNLEGNARLTSRQLKRTDPDIKKYDAVTNSEFELNLNYLPNKKIFFSYTNELYHNNTTNTSRYYSDFSMSYRFKQNEIQLLANNLFGETKDEKYGISSYSETYNLTYLHGRQFLLRYFLNL